MIDNKEDFSTENYKYFIEFISKNYSSVFFSEYDSKKQKQIVLLRHDIDLSISSALRLAKIEHHFGLKSTFFVDMHSEFYNFFEKDSIANLKEILKLGHSIGIHFDSTFWDIKDEVQLVKNLTFEKAIMDETLGIKVNSFSFHNPTEFILSFKKDTYAGLINTYSNRFMNEFKYCSDSNGYWRHERMFDVVESLNHERLHLLTHPGWWTDYENYPRNKVFDILLNRLKITIKNYDNNLLKFNRDNLTGELTKLLFVKTNYENLYGKIDLTWNLKYHFEIINELINIITLQLNEINFKAFNNDKSYFELGENIKKEELPKRLDLILAKIDKYDDNFKDNLIRLKALLNRVNRIYFMEKNEIDSIVLDLFNLINDFGSKINNLN